MFSLVLSVALIAVSLVSCSQPQTASSADTVLPNGVVVDAATKAELEALRPQYDKALVVARSVQAKAIDAGETVTEPAEVQAAREILVQKYGQDGLKYIYTHTEEVKASDMVARPTENVGQMDAGNDSTYFYNLVADKNWSTWPWGSVQWISGHMKALNKVTNYPNACSITSFVARIVDQATPAPGVMNSASNSADVTATAHYLNGIFPGPARPGTGYIDAYDVRLYNGHVSFTFVI